MRLVLSPQLLTLLAASRYVKRYVSTIVIIVNHVQTLTLIGEMRLEWPLLAKQIMAVLSLQTLRIPGANPECVMDEETSAKRWLSNHGR